MQRTLDRFLGIDAPTTGQRIERCAFGLLIPLIPTLYGIASIVSGQSVFPGRWRTVHLDGMSAVSAGVCYLCIGLLIHVHKFWVDHTTLAGLADGARTLLMLVVLVSLVGTLIGVLM